VEAPAEVLDEGMGSGDHPGGSVPLQPSHGSKPGLEAPVVGLQRVVRVDLRVMEGRRQDLVEDAGIEAVSVGSDLQLAKLGIAIGSESEGGVRSHARKGLAEGIEPEAIRHVALLAISTGGYPAAMAAFSWINEVLDREG
jgi:Carboxymuconolactone decarboxylase family